MESSIDSQFTTEWDTCASEAMGDGFVVGVEGIVGADEERARAAGGVADGEGFEDSRNRHSQ